VEIRLLSDQQYGEEFDLVVDEIIDRYVAGEFTGDELERVRNYFFKSKHRQDKLRFARTLKERETNQNPPTPNPKPVDRWTWLPRLSFAPSLALAASLIAVAGIGLLGYRAYFSRPDPREGLIALQLAFPERPVEGRLSDFNHTPLPNQRGGSAKIDYVQRDLAATLLLKTVRDNPTAASHHAVAKYYLMIHQFDQAEKEFAAALALEPKNAKIHNDFGSMFLEEGRLQNLGSDNGKQFELYARGLEEIQTALNLDGSLLEAQFNRALLFQLMKPSDQAKAAWNEYLQHDNSSPWAEEARRNLKLLEQEQRSTTNDNVKTFLQARHDSDDRAAWKTIGETYTAAGNEITNHLVDSLLEAGSVKNAADALDTLSYLAQLEENQSGDRFTRDLVNYYRRAPPGAKSILANARRHMEAGFSLFDEAKFKAAIREYTIAKSHYDQTDDRASKALVEYRLAHCYVLLPDPERARSAFNRLLTLCEQNKYRWLAAQCLFGLAHASADLNEYTKAIDYSSHALANFEQIGDVDGTLKCLSQLADFNQVLSRISAALGYLSNGWALATSRQSHPKERWSLLIQLGFSMASLQLHTAALFYQKEALSLALETGTPLRISRSYAYVGSAYAAMKKYAEATNEATHAFEIGRGMANDPSGIEIMANASQQLGDIQREAGRCDQATEHYDTSLRLYKDLKFAYYEYVAHKGKLYCFMATANNQGVRDELGSVLGLSESYRSKITVESQRDSFFDAEQEVYDVAIAFAESVENDKVKAFEYSEQSRARSLLDAVKRGAELQRKHGESDLHLPSVSRSLSFVQLQKKIPPNVQIVQYAVLDDSLVIWVITKSTIDSAVKPLAAPDLTKKVSAFLDAVTQQPTNSDNFHRELSTDLYNTLIAPIERQLDKSKVLVIVPDKILNFVPYAALTSPDNARYLIEDYDIAVTPSSSLFVSLSAAAERKPRAVEERILSVGNPRFNRDAFKSLRDLPSSAQEARSVADFYPNQGKTVLLRDDAKESKIVSELKKADVAHFAMHFVTDDQSEMLSGFPLTPESSASSATSDGILQSYEIYGLNLRHLRLVVLSACQTGIEKQYRGEGAVGAARPFIVAGVPTVVASLWSVDSDASAQLMIDFHKNRRRSMPVVKALKQSQMELINGQNPLYRHPYYWAPFLTIGGTSSN
jgi:CHAT domain-containing protein/lipoprotein NlpI